MEANDKVLSSEACVSNYSPSLMIKHCLAASFTQKIPKLSKSFAQPISWRCEALHLHIPVRDAVWRDREDHIFRIWHRKGCKEGSRRSRLTQRQTLEVVEARELARKEKNPPSCVSREQGCGTASEANIPGFDGQSLRQKAEISG
jgi:hypothetical protein